MVVLAPAAVVVLALVLVLAWVGVEKVAPIGVLLLGTLVLILVVSKGLVVPPKCCCVIRIKPVSKANRT